MEDCCKPSNNSSKHEGAKKMDKRTFLWIVVGILLIATVYVVFFMNPSTTGQVASATKPAIQQAAASSGMVGGC